MSETATTRGARDHARSQAGTSVATAPTIPVSAASDLPDDVSGDVLVWDETVGAGGYASRVLARHSRLRLVDLEGDACANVLVHRSSDPQERLNVADTVKVQWQAYLGPGSLLLSDMGRVLMSITQDTTGRHDTFCGVSNERRNTQRFGDGSVHGPTPNGRDRFALALAKHGLGRVDIAPNVNFFKGVRVAEDGSLTPECATGPAGAFVELRAEMDVIVTVANTPHVLDPRPEYTATPLRILAYGGPPTEPEDPCRVRSPEAERAFLNTEDLYVR